MTNAINTTETTEITTVETAAAPKAKKPAKKPAKVPGPKYPFRSKASILEQLESDDSFVLACLQIMYERQTAHEQATLSTLNRNKAGFMSSHAVRGSALAVKARGEGLSGDELAMARGIVCRYTKQLAEHFRQVEITNNPELAEIAKIFSAG